MTDMTELYERAAKIKVNIDRIKAVTQKLIDDRELGIKIDRKETLNLACTVKRLMENYKTILECISKSEVSFEEKETILDTMDEAKNAISSLDEAIEEVKAKIDKKTKPTS